MNILSAIGIKNNYPEICILLSQESIDTSEQIGTLTILAVATNIKANTTSLLRLMFDIEPNSDVDMERYNVSAKLDVDLSQYSTFDDLCKFITFQAQTNLIAEAITYEHLPDDLVEQFTQWCESGSNEPFNPEEGEVFGVINLASETAKVICKRIEPYYILSKSGKPEQGV